MQGGGGGCRPGQSPRSCRWHKTCLLAPSPHCPLPQPSSRPASTTSQIKLSRRSCRPPAAVGLLPWRSQSQWPGGRRRRRTVTVQELHSLNLELLAATEMLPPEPQGRAGTPVGSRLTQAWRRCGDCCRRGGMCHGGTLCIQAGWWVQAIVGSRSQAWAMWRAAVALKGGTSHDVMVCLTPLLAWCGIVLVFGQPDLSNACKALKLLKRTCDLPSSWSWSKPCWLWATHRLLNLVECQSGCLQGPDSPSAERN